jgi:hypothetical protein
MTDVLAKADGMEARRAVLGDKEFKIKRRFNPLALSHENWVDLVYPEAKLFLEGLTVQNFKEILNDHRETRVKRNEKNAYLVKVIPDMFRFVESQRLYSLKESAYKKCQKKIEKRSKIGTPVLFFEKNRYKIMELSRAQEILEERKKFEKEQEHQSSTQDFE